MARSGYVWTIETRIRSPKDNFPLLHINVLVDNAIKNATYSFMDGFFSYNQIRIIEEDKEKTTFITP